MIIFANRSWQTDASAPDTNYLEGIDCEQPKWVVPDNSELAGKIKSAPYWTPVEDDSGNLMDRQAIRPLRAIAAGTDTGEDREILADLERQAAEFRQQLDELEEQ